MGLDMYLTRKVYVGLNYEHNRTGESKVVINDKENDTTKLKELVFEAAYWRKHNALHAYFVDRIQDGEDDCKEYYVDREILQEIIDKSKEDMKYLDSLKFQNSEKQKDMFTGKKFSYKIYEDVDESKLNFQTRGGFFFGSTDYDEYFYKDLQDTVEQLEEALKNEDGYFYYHSSW